MMGDIWKNVSVHALINKNRTIDLHTHGMKNYSHSDFQIFVEPFFINQALHILGLLVGYVVEEKKRFITGVSYELPDDESTEIYSLESSSKIVIRSFSLISFAKGILTIVPELPEEKEYRII